MKTSAFVLCACALLLATLACASEPTLWAFDVGPSWDAGASVRVDVSTDPFSVSDAVFPASRPFLMDAHYDAASALLYVSGGSLDDVDWWVQNSIHVYSGGPDHLEYISSSNAGMGDPMTTGYNWLGGIAYMEGSLYAVAQVNFISNRFKGDVVLLRIDNPATAAQTVTQIGAIAGSQDSLGIPFNLCPDGDGGLFSIFERVVSPGNRESTLYRIDPADGSFTPLRVYDASEGVYHIEGLTVFGGSLYAASYVAGRLIRIDLLSYNSTYLGDMGIRPTGLVTIPEPSTVGVLGLALLAGVPWRRGLPGRPRRLR